MWTGSSVSMVYFGLFGGALSLALQPAHASRVHFGAHAALRLGQSALADREKLLERGATVVFWIVACCVGAAAVALTICCMYDTASYWYHKVHFHSCRRKVERVHGVFSRRRGELPLCPYCVDIIADQASPQKVVFLCGHRFHMDCANRWFLENPEKKAGRCPICSEGPLVFPDSQATVPRPSGAPPLGAGAPRATVSVDAEACCPDCREADSSDSGPAPALNDSVSDEAQGFILNSLHRRYPEIISGACVKRWLSCNTELWLSELSCPRWQRHYPCCGQ
mmetsp:Transcript_3758/g.10005  ORF Transcript_3758/g.10005 Transcript_3758/m.10005 type:complete len:280 (+) Transcript_3758:156-995(+)